MARQRDPEHYPEFFTDFVKRVGLEGQTIRVPQIGSMPDDEETTGMQKALKIRALFYAYIGAVKAKRKVGDEKWIEMANYADQTVCFLDKKAVCLVFYPRAKSWQNAILSTGGPVNGESPGPTKSPAEESLAKLKEQLEKGE